jgi:putative transposase
LKVETAAGAEIRLESGCHHDSEKEPTAVKKPYQIQKQDSRADEALRRFTQANGQFLLPLVELIEQSRLAVDEVIHEVGRKTIELLLEQSAQLIAGPRTPGKRSGAVRWHGSQRGRVALADRDVAVERPRLRHQTQGEVGIPAYQALRQNPAQANQMLGALLRGISTREYKDVLPEMAEAVGVSRSSVSRQAIEASEKQLRVLRERRWEEGEILVIYIDGQRFGEHHVMSAVGVDRQGAKHVMGIEPGATENAAAVKRLLIHLRDRGLNTEQRYLFVIDGAKALRAGIDEVFGQNQAIQRCRNHKLQNVLDELPEDQQGQVLNLMRAAWKVHTAEEGEKRLEQLARFLEHDHPSAAGSLREGLAEMFTLQRLKLPPSLHKCLATTNLIESPQSGVRKRTRNITRWREVGMVERWVAAAWLHTEKKFRRIDGHRDLWTLAVILGRSSAESQRHDLAREHRVA